MGLLLKSYGLTPEAIRVLRENGISRVGDLAKVAVPDLQQLFVVAAEKGSYREKFPSLRMLAAWIAEAHSLARTRPDQLIEVPDLSQIPTARVHQPPPGQNLPPKPSESAKMIELRPDRHRERSQVPSGPRREESAGLAFTQLNPTSDRTLVSKRQAEPLNQPANNPAETPAPGPEKVPEDAPPPGVTHQSEPSPPAPGFRSFDDYKKGDVRVRPLDRHHLQAGEDVSTHSGEEQASFEEEQIVKRKLPRTYVRGVHYPNPGQAFFGALVTLVLFLTFHLTWISCLVVPFFFPEWRNLLIYPLAALATFGLLYIFTCLKVRCRVCSCHLFFSRRCLKHAKAHRFLGLGHLFAQSLHMLLFSWFRCMYCGTAIRLRGPRGHE
ncbi:MAG: hypothetical protein AAF514_19720 [Verrucomicrobiota bacterium]